MNNQLLIEFISLHKTISPGSAVIIADHFTYRKIEKGSCFLEAGKYSNEYLFLQTGFMRAFAHDTEGNEITTAFYPAGCVVFEVSSFFNRSISKENIQALTGCDCWVIDFEKLNQLFHSMPEFREFGRAMLVKGFTALKERTLSMITETAEERYRQLLQQNPEVFQHAALKQVASYLGITDTSLSRIRRELTKK